MSLIGLEKRGKVKSKKPAARACFNPGLINSRPSVIKPFDAAGINSWLSTPEGQRTSRFFYFFDAMETIRLQPLMHRSVENIGISFQPNAILEQIVRREPGAKWSQTKRCWYVPLNQSAYLSLTNNLKAVALVDATSLRGYLTKKQQVSAALAIATAPGHATEATSSKVHMHATAWQLSPANLAALTKFVQRLQLKAYSPSTIKTYRNEFLQLLKLLKHKHVDSLTVEDLKRYMVFVMKEQHITENTAHSRLNALKFYFEQVLGREKFFWDIPRPKKVLLLPKLLNEDEIRRLFNALSNKKHKAMLFTAYSAGLRVSEIVQLKIMDIDSKRMQIFIACGKGKKDRYVTLSPVLLDILRNYITTYRPSPRVYLFESAQTMQAYPTRTVQQVFTNAKLKAGIKKEVGVHSLRHSFATHLLDKGTDIRYIKDLLGHFDIRTTERYLHVSKQQLVNIVSPFDDLWNDKKLDW